MDYVTRQRTTGSAHLAFFMAGINAVAGLLRPRTPLNVASGIVAGSVFALSGYLIDEHDVPVGFHVATGASAVTGSAMGWRWWKTGQRVPAGVLAVAALGSTVYHGYKGFQMERQILEAKLEEVQS